VVVGSEVVADGADVPCRSVVVVDVLVVVLADAVVCPEPPPHAASTKPSTSTTDGSCPG
jgi:hypothetical protein